MDYKITQAVYRSTIELTASETLLLYTLAGAAKDSSTLPSPSLARIADRSHLAERSVARIIASLQTKGIVNIAKRRTASGKQCNVYMVDTQRLGQQAPVLESVSKDDTDSPVTHDLESYNNNKHDTESPMTVCHPTPDTKSPVPMTQSHPTPDTESYNNNTFNNKEDNSRQDLDLDSVVDGGQGGTSQPSRSVCHLEGPFKNVRANQAFAKLKAEGMPADEAEARIRAVQDKWKHEREEIIKRGWTEPSGKAIKLKDKYLVIVLANMAKECDLSASNPSEPEPRALLDILDLLRDRALKTCEEKLGDLDPLEKGEVKNCFDPDMLVRQKYPQWKKLTEKEELEWYNEPSPVACVEKVLGLNFALQGIVAKIEAERYKLAKRRIPEYRARIPELEKQLEGKSRPVTTKPGEGYVLVPWQNLDKMRKLLPVYEKRVALYEKSHKEITQ